MPIERSLLNLLSFCRVIRHKSLFPNRIYAKGIRKLFASCAKSIVNWIEVGSGRGAAANQSGFTMENQQRHRAPLDSSGKCKKEIF